MLSLRAQVFVWIGFFVLTFLVLWVLRGILLPFVVGLALAYLLNPVVVQLEKLRIGRGWATAITLLLVIAAFAGVFLMVLPLGIQQGASLLQGFPGYVAELRDLGNQWVPAFNEWIGPERAAQLEVMINDFLGQVPGWTAAISAQIAQNGLNILGTIGLVVIAPVVAFYMLLDWDALGKNLDDLLPRDQRSEIRSVLADINRSMSGVIRGQGSVVLVDCFYYATALTLTGLSYGLVIGLISGLLSFIPFVGFLTGFTLSMTIATVQFWPNWVMIVVVFAVFMIGQFLEGNVLYPKLVGSSIGINPVWLMFALFSFALLFGFVGLLLAVPLAAITAVLTRFAIRKYKDSQLYLGKNGHGDAS